jgi:hypothetical protein
LVSEFPAQEAKSARESPKRELVIGGMIEPYVGGGWGYIFDWYGFVIGGMYVLFFTSTVVGKKKKRKAL